MRTHSVARYPLDGGIVGADIFRMNAEGRAVEHWEVLQIVGTPENAAPWFAPDLQALNTNGVL